MDPLSGYEAFAWVYNRHWYDYATRILPVLDRLLLHELSPGARVLDLCCGTGNLAQHLVARGYVVSGLDASPAMLDFARRNAPGAHFLLGDARSFRSEGKYEAVISTFDSLNHVMNLAELTSVFRCVRGSLRPGGRFCFDLNMEPGYRARWRGSFGIVEDDHVCVVRSQYEPATHIGRAEITIFRAAEGQEWQRSDLVLTQRCYSEADVLGVLEVAGFTEISIHDAHAELGEVGRSLFLCRTH